LTVKKAQGKIIFENSIFFHKKPPENKIPEAKNIDLYEIAIS